jgi:hypothetical protein
MAGETETRGVFQYDLMERGRRAVFGYLGTFILHETNNVLTVMSGVRQLMKSARPLPERVGPMIDNQLAKVEQLMEWIRTLRPEEGPGATRIPLRDLVEATHQVLLLGAKGHRLVVTPNCDETLPLTGEAAGPLILGILCSTLPFVRAPLGRRLHLAGRSSDQEVVVEAILEPPPEAAERDPDVQLAGELLAAQGGGLEQGPSASGWQVTVRMPRIST